MGTSIFRFPLPPVKLFAAEKPLRKSMSRARGKY